MKYALVNGLREKAWPGGSGICPACDNQMIAKCGSIRIHHWAHRGESHCDPWWESETEWHRAWKDRFPTDWQEVVHSAENGEKHIADVKTDQGWVLEFQHSPIGPDERKAREAFYKKLVWIVDGARRKRDKSQFIKACEHGRMVVGQLNLSRIPIQEESALLRDWADSCVPVFFDFSGSENLGNSTLWCLIRVIDGMAYGGPFPRESFIKYHNPEAIKEQQAFSQLLSSLNAIISMATQRRQISPTDPRDVLLRQVERRYRERLKRKRRHF